MTEDEARTMRAGDLVLWDDTVEGVVIDAHATCITIRFDDDDDEYSYLHPRDCQRVSGPPTAGRVVLMVGTD